METLPNHNNDDALSASPGSTEECCCYLCNECPKSFSTLDKLQSHMNFEHLPSTTTHAHIRDNSPSARFASSEASLESAGRGDTEQIMPSSTPLVDFNGNDVGIADAESCTKLDHYGNENGVGHEKGSEAHVHTAMDHIKTGAHNGQAFSDSATTHGSAARGYPCEKCGRVFADRDQLNIHYTHTHREKPQYVCDICEKVFAVKRELSTHLRTHSGEEPHQCAQCGKQFGTRQLLKKHNMWHTGERTHMCPEPHCQKKFFQKGHLTQHLMIHTGGRPHRCTLCEKTFIFKFDLNRHMKIHLERGNCCQRCGKCFPKLVLLEDHVATCAGGSLSPKASPHTSLSDSPLDISTGVSPSSPHFGASPRATKRHSRTHSRGASGKGGNKSKLPKLTAPSPASLPPVASGDTTVEAKEGLWKRNVAAPYVDVFEKGEKTANPQVRDDATANLARALLAQQQLLASHIHQVSGAGTTGLAPFLHLSLPQQVPTAAAAALAIGSFQAQQPQQLKTALQQHPSAPTLFYCYVCAKEFPTQIAYLLHWSLAHGQNNNNNLTTTQPAQPYQQGHPLANISTSHSLRPPTSVGMGGAEYALYNSATNSSCASSPQKVSPTNSCCQPDELCVSIEDDSKSPRPRHMKTLSNGIGGADPRGNNCRCGHKHAEQQQVELEKQLLDTRQELLHLREVMQRVGTIANSLFNSCSSNGALSVSELEKLWTLQAK